MSDKNINNKYFLSKTKSQNELFKDQKTSTNDLDDNLPKKTILKKNFSSLGTPSNFLAVTNFPSRPAKGDVLTPKVI